jgi:hypothetical protein
MTQSQGNALQLDPPTLCGLYHVDGLVCEFGPPDPTTGKPNFATIHLMRGDVVLFAMVAVVSAYGKTVWRAPF